MLSKGTILLCCTLFFLTNSFGQQTDYSEPARLVTSTKFYYPDNGVIIFNVRLDDNTDTLNFIFDTGATSTFIDSTYAAEAKLNLLAQRHSARSIGGKMQIRRSENHTIKINDLRLDSLNIYILDIELLSYLYGKRIHGIIGYPLLQKYITKIDYNKKKLSFYTFGKLKFPKRGFFLHPRIKTFAYGTTQISDDKNIGFNYFFDSGAPQTALFSSSFVLDSAFIKPKRKKYKIYSQELGGNVVYDICVIKKLKFGKYTFRNMPVNIFDDVNNITAYPENHGIIGNDILARFNCILDYHKGLFHFKPNKYFKKNFDYAYSGFELFLIDDKIIVGQISENSPAAKAGLVFGDEIMAINKKFVLNFSEAKRILQSGTEPSDIYIKRKDSMLKMQLNPIDIRN